MLLTTAAALLMLFPSISDGLSVPTTRSHASVRSLKRSSTSLAYQQIVADAEDIFSDFPSMDTMEASVYETLESAISKSAFLEDNSQLIHEEEEGTILAPRKELTTTNDNKMPKSLTELDIAMKKNFYGGLSARDYLQQETHSKNRRRTKPKNLAEPKHRTMSSYVKDMCKHENLSRNDEVVLGREIQILMRWEETREKTEAQLGR